MYDFLSGMITMGYAIAALFFFRFWWRTRDPLFVMFAIAFICFAVNQALTALLDIPRDEQSWIYMLRLAGFVLLIFGIVGKNVGKKPPRQGRAPREPG
jgi:uncharacterized membrane protein HdeD (DUF308 family)